MPIGLERKLKKEYPHNDHAVYGTLNKLGLLHGDRTTSKERKSSAVHKALMHKKDKDYAKEGNRSAHKRIKRSEFNKI